MRKRVINTRALAGAARAMGVGDWIHLAEYEHRRGGRKQVSAPRMPRMALYMSHVTVPSPPQY